MAERDATYLFYGGGFIIGKSLEWGEKLQKGEIMG